jgi:hypothetical protein
VFEQQRLVSAPNDLVSLVRRSVASAAAALVITGQRIQAGDGPRRTRAVRGAAHHTIPIYDDDQTVLVQVPRTTTKSIARFKSVNLNGNDESSRPGGVGEKAFDVRSLV